MKKIFLFITICFLFVSCKTIQNTASITSTKTDTCYINKLQRDSVYITDSVFVNRYIKGDTVFVFKDKWKTQYIEKIHRDTIYLNSDELYQEEKTITLPPERYIPRTLIIMSVIGLGFLIYHLGKVILKIYLKIKTGGIL